MSATLHERLVQRAVAGKYDLSQTTPTGAVIFNLIIPFIVEEGERFITFTPTLTADDHLTVFQREVFPLSTTWKLSDQVTNV